MKYHYSGKLYIQVGDERVIGPGRVELLEKINETGSIRQAALQMNMSYRQAWQFVDHMNNHLGEPVVITERGGKGGGKAQVTPKGFAVITQFKSFHKKFQAFLRENSLEIDLH